MSKIDSIIVYNRKYVQHRLPQALFSFGAHCEYRGDQDE